MKLAKMICKEVVDSQGGDVSQAVKLIPVSGDEGVTGGVLRFRLTDVETIGKFAMGKIYEVTIEEAVEPEPEGEAAA